VEATGVYFVMCHDGADVASVFTDAGHTLEEDQAKVNVSMQETLRKTRFRAMICSLINRGYNIALINGLQFIDTKVSSAKSLRIGPVDS